MIVKRLPYDTLCHHGVKGQRWGIRKTIGRHRYNNPDGSLNSLGKHRYEQLKKNRSKNGEGDLSPLIKKVFNPKKMAAAGGVYSAINGAMIGTSVAAGASAIATGAAITGAILGTALYTVPVAAVGGGSLILADKAINKFSDYRLQAFERDYVNGSKNYKK